jgi:REP element-mobilizing transposase RayT
MTAADPSSRLPEKGYDALRRFRWSAGGAEYFLTFNAVRPATGLTNPTLLDKLIEQRERLERDGVWQVRTWTVMPDHVHILARLGVESSLEDCLRLFKGRLAPALRQHGLSWQAGYYEHQMRPHEEALPVFLYIFLNAYRAHLLPADAKWPGYYCAADDWEWFAPLTNSAAPFPEWLR